MAENAPGYNVAVVRRLLISAFTPEDLKRFCQDRPVLAAIIPRFGSGQGLDDMVGEVIDYCQTHYLWEDLLSGVKQESPRQYARFEANLHLPIGVDAAFPQRMVQGWRSRTWRRWVGLAGIPLAILAVAVGIWRVATGGPGQAATPAVDPALVRTEPFTSVVVATELPEPYHQVWRAVGGEAGLLGLPVGTAISRRYSVQEFERGVIFFRDNKYNPPENWMYVIYWGEGSDKSTGSSWVRHMDTWLAGDPALSCIEAAPLPLGPAGGFGKLWCEHPEVQAGLGAALQQEANVKGGWLDFEHGVMLYDIWNKRVFVLFENQHWRSFAD
jgi:hypothetical protein